MGSRGTSRGVGAPRRNRGHSPRRFSLLRNHPVRRDPAAQSRRNPRGAGRTKGPRSDARGEADRSLFGMSSSEQSQPVPVAVAFGDGIGPAIMEATLRILEAAKAPILPERIEIGEKVYLSGVTSGIEPGAWDVLRRARVF